MVPIDITSDASIDAAVAHIKAKFGYLDVLVNNAGISQPSSPDVTMREHYQQIFNVNVFSHAVVTDKMLPLLRASRSTTKRIVFVGSSIGSLAVEQDPDHYSYLTSYEVYRGSKAALNMQMVYYSQILKTDDIAVLSMCPGGCATNLNAYPGSVAPEEGAKVIVKAVTEGSNKEKNGAWFDKQGKLPF